MNLQSILAVAATILTSLGGAAVLVVGLSRWLGGVWAARIVKSEEFKLQLEQDIVTRRRDIYARLATSLRVFLRGSTPSSEEDKRAFLQAYDEAYLWASEEVVKAVGEFLKLQIINTQSPNIVAIEIMHVHLHACLVAMRKDVGFPKSTTDYVIVAFQQPLKA